MEQKGVCMSNKKTCYLLDNRFVLKKVAELIMLF